MIYLDGETGWYSMLFLLEFRTGTKLLTRNRIDRIWAGELDSFEWQASLLEKHAEALFQMFAPGVPQTWRDGFARFRQAGARTENAATYRFTTAELVLLTQYLTGSIGHLGPGRQADPGADAEALRLAEQNLLGSGLLVRAEGDGEIDVTSRLATLLSAALSPQVLCVLRNTGPDVAGEEVYFSFSSACIVRNHVDTQGQHVFSELANLDEALNGILVAGGVRPGQTMSSAGEVQSLDRLLDDRQARVTLLVVADPAQPQPQVQALSWLIARGGVWLVQESADSGAPSARSVDVAELRQMLSMTLSQQWAFVR
ncbi:MAG TPA: hypothetical protein VF952_04835 [Chloroflexia bacterium]